MQLKSLLIKLLFASSSLLMPFLYAGEEKVKPISQGPLAAEWSSSDYVLYGAFIAAIVLFVISVMKKPDEIF